MYLIETSKYTHTHTHLKYFVGINSTLFLFQTLSMESIYVPDPVLSLSIKPSDKKKTDNFSKAVQRFTKEDPTFRIWFDNDSKETIASGKMFLTFKSLFDIGEL